MRQPGSKRNFRPLTVSVIAAGMLLSGATVASADLLGFHDVEAGSAHGEAIGWLVDNGITSGCDADSFCPTDDVSRAQLATFLRRLSVGEVVNAGTVEGLSAEDLRGQAGPQGEQGVAGSDGDDGADGAPGPQGEVGPQGQPGETGPQGAQGEQGLQGLTGPAGADGAKGETGLQGEQGIQGLTGSAGADGADGADGATGPQGPQGPAGLLPGFEIVVGNASSNAVATCPTGKIIIGGSTSPTGAEGSHPTYAYADHTTNSFRAGGTSNVEVRAICIDGPHTDY